MVNLKRTTLNLSYLAILGIVAGIFYIYLQTLDFAFINFDDDLYVYENKRSHQGSLADRIKWAFTSFRTGNWHPLHVESVAWVAGRKDVLSTSFGLLTVRFAFTGQSTAEDLCTGWQT